jgi:hypothetical protein
VCERERKRERERERERDREGGRPTHYLSETESLYISTQNPKVCESTNGKEGEWERDKSLQKLPLHFTNESVFTLPPPPPKLFRIKKPALLTTLSQK